MMLAINVSAIVALFISCQVAPLFVGIPVGIGARIFHYQIIPGSISHRLLFIFSGIVGSGLVDLIYQAIGFSLDWWPFAVVFALFAAMCSNKKLDINGLALTAGSATGCLIWLANRSLL